jgi:TPR repeat protein
MEITVDRAFFDRQVARATQGDVAAAFDLGVAYSTGTRGAALDLIAAHQWFNLAAAWGHEDAPGARSDVAEDMTAREIATAQKLARGILAQTQRRAA